MKTHNGVVLKRYQHVITIVCKCCNKTANVISDYRVDRIYCSDKCKKNGVGESIMRRREEKLAREAEVKKAEKESVFDTNPIPSMVVKPQYAKWAEPERPLSIRERARRTAQRVAR